MKDWLENAEIRYRLIFGTKPVPPGGRSDLQVYAYHDEHNPANIPVICIGSNYSQGAGQTHKRCSTNLNSTPFCLDNYFWMRAVFEQYPQWKHEWVQHMWSSACFPYLPAKDELFFVMTNLCPWITTGKWSALPPTQASGLLSASKIGGEYRHIEDLLSMLTARQRHFVVVLHGINDNICDELLDLFKDRDNWLLYPNFTWKRTPIRWDAGKNKFVFSLGKGDNLSASPQPVDKSVLGDELEE
jgi:hypothetical protein